MTLPYVLMSSAIVVTKLRQNPRNSLLLSSIFISPFKAINIATEISSSKMYSRTACPV